MGCKARMERLLWSVSGSCGWQRSIQIQIQIQNILVTQVKPVNGALPLAVQMRRALHATWIPDSLTRVRRLGRSEVGSVHGQILIVCMPQTNLVIARAGAAKSNAQ